jgi:DNA-directed RNA polymerase alpha subunit
MAATDDLADAGLTNAQAHALQQIRDALPGVVYTTTVLRQQLTAAWQGRPDLHDLPAEVHARLDAIAAAIEDADRLVRPYVDQSPIEDLGLPGRAVTVLRDREGIRTIAQLSRWTEADLGDVPGIGRVLRREIKVRLRKRGIVLPPSGY